MSNTINYAAYSIQRAATLLKECVIIDENQVRNDPTMKLPVFRVNEIPEDRRAYNSIGRSNSHVIVFKAMTKSDAEAAFETLKQAVKNGQTEIDSLTINDFLFSAGFDFETTEKQVPMKGQLIDCVLGFWRNTTERGKESNPDEHLIVTDLSLPKVKKGVSADALFNFDDLIPATEDSEESHDLEEEEIVGKVTADVEE